MKRVIGIYLAAGSSRRMGRDKLKLPLGGAMLGGFALRTALHSRLDRVIVVTREQEPPIWLNASCLEEPLRSRWEHAYCPQAEYGQAWSLRCGLAAALMHQPDAVMILLADQPYITVALLDGLIQCYWGDDVATPCNPAPLFAAASYQGIFRPPVVIDRRLYDEIFELTGDEGARALLKRHASAGIEVVCDQPRLFLDADTEESYQLLLREEKEGWD